MQASFQRAVLRLSFPVLTAIALTACGGGSNSTVADVPVASVSVSVAPATIVVGQSATVTWASNTTGCTASGAWTGAQAASGTLTVTPTTTGPQNYSLLCTGGGYSDKTAAATLTVNPASAYTQTLLVADTTGTPALRVDANLVNPWGLVLTGTAPAWVSNAGTNTSTLYDGAGVARPVIVQLANVGAAPFSPTGIVANSVATDFVVSSAGKSANAAFIFNGEGGAVAGWATSVDATHAITMFTATDGAVYKGLAVARIAGQAYLYATDFKNNKIDVFNNAYVKQASTATSFAFKDATVPAGYAPFGIQAIDNGAGGATQIYVSYAQQKAPANVDNNNGAGLGYVAVFDTSGALVKHLVSGGRLNAPWGLALAPANFGTLSGALLVGNFGDGRINGYDAATGSYVGTVANSAGTPFANPGLWGIAFGNDANNQPHGALFYAAGVGGELHGNYGRYDLGTTPPALGTTPTSTLTVPASPLKGTVTLTATATAGVAVAKVEFYTGATLIGTATASPYTTTWDTTKVANGTAPVRAVVTDINGNVGSSAIANTTVGN